MVLLPPNPRGARLRCFYASVCLFGSVFICIGASLYGTQFIWLGVPLSFICVVGMLTPRFIGLPYRAWNKLARLYAQSAEALVLRISFFTVCVPASWFGSQIRVKPPRSEGSLWLPRNMNHQSVPSQKRKKMLKETWIVRYIVWSWQSDERWRLVLLPFLMVLSSLQPAEQELTVPDNIYTLF